MTKMIPTPADGLPALTRGALARHFAYVDGAWVAGAQSDDFNVTDPASGAVLGAVAKLSAEDSRGAVDAAHAAFPHWSGLLPQERGAILRRWRDLMLENREDL
ncbi:aldehyde dehydrogenase family protein, partial [Sulfitobacter sp. HI0054]